MGNMLCRSWHPVATVPDLDRQKVLALGQRCYVCTTE